MKSQKEIEAKLKDVVEKRNEKKERMDAYLNKPAISALDCNMAAEFKPDFDRFNGQIQALEWVLDMSEIQDDYEKEKHSNWQLPTFLQETQTKLRDISKELDALSVLFDDRDGGANNFKAGIATILFNIGAEIDTIADNLKPAEDDMFI